jgi:hypothetical protein
MTQHKESKKLQNMDETNKAKRFHQLIIKKISLLHT